MWAVDFLDGGRERKIHRPQPPTLPNQNAAVRALPAACPHLNVTVKPIGTSAKGVDILTVALTSPAPPSSSLGRPNVKYVAGLHGDEPSGRQLLLALAEYVCFHTTPGATGSDARVAKLLDRVSLHLAPALNPDGFAVRSRANAAGVDLNRDADADDADFLAPSGSEQPETAAIMKWILETGFVASAAMHEVWRREKREEKS
jgi:carboxypeptidase D